MANHVSALKAARQIERRTEINRVRRTRVRNQIRAMRRALEKKDLQSATQLLPVTFSLVDRAAKWGIIKKNTAARYKSRLHNNLKKLAA
ncbi:MAG: 30S ribosomal protein S20 [Bryobacterales bacterium]|nr:30S ribosomal protein S20 [Bryobacterales bacterium]